MNVWQWRDEESVRIDGWTLLGTDPITGAQDRVLWDYDSFRGAQSIMRADVDEKELPVPWVMTRKRAEELARKIEIMDEVYWPGFGPVLAKVNNGKIVGPYPPEER